MLLVLVLDGVVGGTFIIVVGNVLVPVLVYLLVGPFMILLTGIPLFITIRHGTQ